MGGNELLSGSGCCTCGCSGVVPLMGPHRPLAVTPPRSSGDGDAWQGALALGCSGLEVPLVTVRCEDGG